MAKRKAPKIKPPPDPESEAWNKIPWRKLEQHCFRIQKRIFRASQRGNTRAVHKLQKLLMKAQSARLLAVRRVTQDNQGKKTAGIDGVKSVKPAQRSVMANQIHPKNWKDISPPVRRVWIPKPGKSEKRPLGIPRWAAHCLPFQAMFGIPWLFLLVDRNLRSTNIVLLYHKLPQNLSVSLLPLPFDRLTQGGNDLWRECNPAWSQRRRTNTLQDASFAPIRDGRDIDIEQVCGGASRVPSISPLPSWDSFWAFWASSRDVIGIANPLDFADCKRASHPSSLSFLIEEGCNLRIGMRRRPFPHALDDLCAGLTFFPRHLVPWDGQPRESLCLPANSHIDDVATLGERDILDQPPQQLLALGKGGGGSMKDCWQVVGQATDLLSLHSGKREDRLFGSQSIFPFQLFDLGQLLIPFAFQTPGYQPIVRVHGTVAAAPHIRLILCSLDLTVPLALYLPGAGFQRIKRRESHLQVGRLDGL